MKFDVSFTFTLREDTSRSYTVHFECNSMIVVDSMLEIFNHNGFFASCFVNTILEDKSE